jgi:hypothetical protein
MAKKPVRDPVPHPQQRTPTPQRPSKPLLWTFSFRFWRQIEYFGLDKSQPSWFVSLLERLTELSKFEVDEFRSDPSSMRYHRYHKIDWDQKNIPIKREDLNWIDSDYRINPDDYPLGQFMISKGMGRVVGFWDENNVFCIVLLDPLHNIQPSQYYSYKIDPCSPLACQYTSLLIDINNARNQKCDALGCPVRMALDRIPSLDRHEVREVIVVEKGTGEWISSLIASNRIESIRDVIEAGILVIDTGGIDDQGQITGGP